VLIGNQLHGIVGMFIAVPLIPLVRETWVFFRPRVRLEGWTSAVLGLTPGDAAAATGSDEPVAASGSGEPVVAAGSGEPAVAPAAASAATAPTTVAPAAAAGAPPAPE